MRASETPWYQAREKCMSRATRVPRMAQRTVANVSAWCIFQQSYSDDAAYQGEGVSLSVTTGNDRPTLLPLAWLLCLGFVLRVAIAPLFGGFGYDMAVLRNWARTLADQPLRRFYDIAMAPDHLPGDLWFLKVLVTLFHGFGGEHLDGTTFLISLKLVPTIADVLIGLMIYIIVSQHRPVSLALKATASYVLNPATIFLTSVWGQWDSVSAALLLCGFILIRRRDRLWIAAAPVLAWAVVIKPPLALVALLLCALPASRLWRAEGTVPQRLRAIIMELGLAAALGLGTLLAIVLPFDVGLPGMDTRWSLVDRITVALDLYPFTTLGAFNVWMIQLGSLERVSDLDTRWLSLSANQWGTLLLTIVVVYVAFEVFQRIRLDAVGEVVWWGALAVSLATFMVPTRVHERYLFPAIVFAILYAALCGFPRLLVILSAILSMTFFINLVMVYGGFRGAIPGAIVEGTDAFLFRAVSIVNVIVFGLVLALPRSEPTVECTTDDPGRDRRTRVLR